MSLSLNRLSDKCKPFSVHWKWPTWEFFMRNSYLLCLSSIYRKEVHHCMQMHALQWRSDVFSTPNHLTQFTTATVCQVVPNYDTPWSVRANPHSKRAAQQEAYYVFDGNGSHTPLEHTLPVWSSEIKRHTYHLNDVADLKTRAIIK